jgi:glycosyltransferase involved in cell wall biosynthesis
MKHPISAVYIARNEEMIIGQSLDAVKEWVDEIILMDMQSSDATAEISRIKGAIVLETEMVMNFSARTTAIKKAKHQWILLLDADEIISEGLAKEIIQSIKNNDADLLLLPRANFALSGFGIHESDFPEHLFRCFKKEAMDIDGYKGEIHASYQPKNGIRIKKLNAAFPESCIYHLTNPTLDFFISKINNYSTAEAKEQYTDNLKFSKIRVLFIGFKVFWNHYISRCGYKDGWRGFWLSIVFSFYRVLVVGKLWEMRLHKGKYPTVKEARDQMFKCIAPNFKKCFKAR